MPKHKLGLSFMDVTLTLYLYLVNSESPCEGQLRVSGAFQGRYHELNDCLVNVHNARFVAVRLRFVTF